MTTDGDLSPASGRTVPCSSPGVSHGKGEAIDLQESDLSAAGDLWS